MPKHNWFVPFGLGVLAVAAGHTLAQDRVAIVAAASTLTTDCRYTDVQSKLMATGKFSQVDIFNVTSSGTGTPTLGELQGYSAVLVWSNSQFASAEAMGNVLADYVDGGGGVVVGVFANASIALAGRWSPDYEVIIPSGQSSGTRLTLGTVHDPGHPLMERVASLDGGSASFMPTTTVLSSGSTEIAQWSDGRTLAATGRHAQRVDLALYPPSSDCRADFWESTTDGAILMANALVFAGGGGTPSCYPDCDNNEVLDFFDFLCFQNAFLAGDPYADCDNNQVLDFFDFLCFQNAFLAGCP